MLLPWCWCTTATKSDALRLWARGKRLRCPARGARVNSDHMDVAPLRTGWSSHPCKARRIAAWTSGRRGASLLVKQRVRHVKLFETAADAVERLVHAVGKLQQVVFAPVDGAPIEHLPPVDYAIPITAAVNEDEIAALQLACLHQGEHFPKLVHGAETPRKDDERLGELREPQLAHEKVVKLKIEPGTDVGVRPLLMGQFDAQTDGFAAGLGRAAVGRLHDAGTAAGTDDEPPGMLTQR